MKNLSVIGIGRLGLCFALTLEKSGFNVVGVDIVKEYVDKINDKTFASVEPHVNGTLARSKNLHATIDLKKAVDHGELIFVTVRTESEPDGKYDVSQVDSVVDSLVELGKQQDKKHLVICSNVNPGYSNTVADRLNNLNWTVSFNPETVAQGTILYNQSYPDCVYIGAESNEIAHAIEKVYEKVCMNSPIVHTMDRLSAELTKVSMNCFLTVKISFANMVGDIASKIGANPHSVLNAVGSDSRINNKFFRYGFGWGGPCFPRDTRAFIRLAELNEMPADLCIASNSINDKHLDFQYQQYAAEYDVSETIFFDSVTYKPGTNIIEESQQLKLAVRLARNGRDVVISDSPEVQEIVKEKYGDLFRYE